MPDPFRPPDLQVAFCADCGRSGKSEAVALAAVRHSAETGKPVAVTQESMKRRIIDVSKRLGVQIPEPEVIKIEPKPPQPLTLAGVIIDYF